MLMMLLMLQGGPQLVEASSPGLSIIMSKFHTYCIISYCHAITVYGIAASSFCFCSCSFFFIASCIRKLGCGPESKTRQQRLPHSTGCISSAAAAASLLLLFFPLCCGFLFFFSIFPPLLCILGAGRRIKKQNMKIWQLFDLRSGRSSPLPFSFCRLWCPRYRGKKRSKWVRLKAIAICVSEFFETRFRNYFGHHLFWRRRWPRWPKCLFSSSFRTSPLGLQLSTATAKK